jgi:muconolactone delta-isomerase
MTLKLIQQMATRALEKLHDKKIALADKLTSQGGVNALGKRQEAAERTHGIDGTNDRSENKFAIADYVMRTYRGFSVFNASGIVQQRSAHDFDRPSRVVSDRRKRKQTAEPPPEFTGGFFWTLSRALRHSLLTMARHELEAAGCRCCPLGMGGGP